MFFIDFKITPSTVHQSSALVDDQTNPQPPIGFTNQFYFIGILILLLLLCLIIKRALMSLKTLRSINFEKTNHCEVPEKNTDFLHINVKNNRENTTICFNLKIVSDNTGVVGIKGCNAKCDIDNLCSFCKAPLTYSEIDSDSASTFLEVESLHENHTLNLNNAHNINNSLEDGKNINSSEHSDIALFSSEKTMYHRKSVSDTNLNGTTSSLDMATPTTNFTSSSLQNLNTSTDNEYNYLTTFKEFKKQQSRNTENTNDAQMETSLIKHVTETNNEPISKAISVTTDNFIKNSTACYRDLPLKDLIDELRLKLYARNQYKEIHDTDEYLF